MRRKSNRYNYYSSYSSYSPYNNRKKVRRKRIAIVILAIVLIIGVVVAFNFKRIRLMYKGYSWSEASIVLDMSDDNIDILLEEDKIENLTTWTEYNDDASYYDEYEKYYALFPDIDLDELVETMDEYVDEIADDLEDLGYTEKQIWSLLETQSNSELQFLIDNDLEYRDIEDYVDYKYFKCSNVLDYDKAVKEYGDVSYAVNIVNFPFIISSNVDEDDDTSYTILNPEDISVLVKKGFYYSTDYEPDDLREVNITKNPTCEYPLLRDEAATALEEMAADAEDAGYYLVLNSGYRSYEDQVAVYDEYEELYGGQYAAEYVATPAASEHQSGLGVDLTSQSVVDGEKITFGDTVEYGWVMENCYKYGFIIRFEEDEADITGIAHEPWHLRYVGVDAATECYENDWTYEEYCLYNSVLPEVDYYD